MTDDAPSCPVCTLDDLLDGGDFHECNTCGHEFPKAESDALGDITDANGNLLQNGDAVTLIKDLKITGKSGRLKAGTKISSIRLVAGDHEVDGKVDGRPMLVRAKFVKKA